MKSFIRHETVDDYAIRTGLSEKTVYAMIRRGELDALKEPPAGSGNHYWVIRTTVQHERLRAL